MPGFADFVAADVALADEGRIATNGLRQPGIGQRRERLLQRRRRRAGHGDDRAAVLERRLEAEDCAEVALRLHFDTTVGARPFFVHGSQVVGMAPSTRV